MTDNEIIKTLENNVSKCRLYEDNDRLGLYESALDIINRLKAENERFKNIESTINEFWTGLEKLSMFKGKEKPTLEELLEYIERVKVEAYKEFAWRFQNELKNFELSSVSVPHYDQGYKDCMTAVEDLVDNLLVEMVGENCD